MLASVQGGRLIEGTVSVGILLGGVFLDGVHRRACPVLQDALTVLAGVAMELLRDVSVVCVQDLDRAGLSAIRFLVYHFVSVIGYISGSLKKMNS